jgi:hypothetical protein
VTANGPTSLQVGLSGTYNVIVSNPGIASAPVELSISFGGKLQQTGQLRVPDGFDCSEGTGSVRCTIPQFQPKTTATVTVQGRGPTAGPGQLTVNINSSDPAAQFVQKSQQLNVTIT